MVLGGSLGLETSLLLGLGFQVTAVDFSATLSEESLQRNPLAEHHVVDVGSLGALLAGRFSIIAANLSLQVFDRRQIEQLFTTAVGVLLPLGIFALRVDASSLVPGSEKAASEKDRSPIKPVEVTVNHKWITALVERELEHVAVERWNGSRSGAQHYLLEVVGARPGGDSPGAWPVLHPAIRRRPVEPVQGR